MPDPALPIPPAPERAASRLVRSYRDPLGRPLTGAVSLLPLEQADGQYVAVTVPIELVDGTATADLPPGTYLLSGILRTADRTPVVINEKITHGRR